MCLPFLHWFILSLFFLQEINQISAEVFSATDDVADLYFVEAAVIAELNAYIKDQEQRLQILKKQAAGYEEKHKQASVNTSDYFLNPLNAYLITKRLTKDLNGIKEIIANGKEDIFQHLTHEGQNLRLPLNSDLKGATSALVRLQDTYNLNTLDISNGNFKNMKSPILTADDCYEIGYEAYEKHEYEHALPWLQLAIERSEDDSIPQKNKTKILILELIAYSYKHMGNHSEALKYIENILKLDGNNEHARNNKILSNLLKLQKEEPSRTSSHKNITTIKSVPQRNEFKWMNDYNELQIELYKKLCRKEIAPSAAQLAQLKCRYETNNIPFLRIAPFKVEESSLDPYIVTFHDVLSDNEIEVIKELSKPKLRRAGVESFDGKSVVKTADYRVSKSAWLKDNDHKVINRVTNRVADMTKFKQNSSELLQVVNYGIGGQYEPHFDFAYPYDLSFELEGIGNRIATVLFYMSDVKEGGATAFPFLDTALWPKKGSAAFWHNLYKSGEGDYRTKHAGCPVLIGSKWVANKWIHLRDQEFIRPCGLYPDHPDDLET